MFSVPPERVTTPVPDGCAPTTAEEAEWTPPDWVREAGAASPMVSVPETASVPADWVREPGAEDPRVRALAPSQPPVRVTVPAADARMVAAARWLDPADCESAPGPE